MGRHAGVDDAFVTTTHCRMGDSTQRAHVGFAGIAAGKARTKEAMPLATQAIYTQLPTCGMSFPCTANGHCATSFGLKDTLPRACARATTCTAVVVASGFARTPACVRRQQAKPRSHACTRLPGCNANRNAGLCDHGVRVHPPSGARRAGGGPRAHPGRAHLEQPEALGQGGPAPHGAQRAGGGGGAGRCQGAAGKTRGRRKTNGNGCSSSHTRAEGFLGSFSAFRGSRPGHWCYAVHAAALPP